jgi:hypothetical protein
MIEQFMGLLRAEHTANRFGRYHCGQGSVDLMPLPKFRPLIAPVNGRVHPRLDEGRGIHDDDAKQAAAGIVREPETRHGSNLGPLEKPARPRSVENLAPIRRASSPTHNRHRSDKARWKDVSATTMRT